MSWLKVLGPSLLAVVFAGCSFTGGNAPITEGSASTSVNTV